SFRRTGARWTRVSGPPSAMYLLSPRRTPAPPPMRREAARPPRPSSCRTCAEVEQCGLDYAAGHYQCHLTKRLRATLWNASPDAALHRRSEKLEPTKVAKERELADNEVRGRSSDDGGDTSRLRD